jgi:hypothetical protein
MKDHTTKLSSRPGDSLGGFSEAVGPAAEIPRWTVSLLINENKK